MIEEKSKVSFLIVFPVCFFLLVKHCIFSPVVQADECPPHFLIGLMDNQIRVRLTASSEFWIASTERIEKFNAGEILEVTVFDTKDARFQYLNIAKTIPYGESAMLEEELAFWKRYGYKPRVINAGVLLESPLVGPIDGRRYWVAVMKSDTPEAARLAGDAIQKKTGRKTWIHEELVRRQEGILRVTRDGKFTGEYRQPILVRSACGIIKLFRHEYGTGYPWHGFEDRCFRGEMIVMPDRKGRVEVINVVTLEDYLKGVVGSEISPKAPLEAIKAQAICARSEALAKYKSRHTADLYDLCASQHCQVYSGISREHPLVTRAVEETKGMVLMHGNQIVDAVYSACCGGHTENNENVWVSEPSPCLRGVPDFEMEQSTFTSPISEEQIESWVCERPAAYCGMDGTGEGDKYRWRVTMTADKVNRLVRKVFPNVGEVLEIIPVTRGVSGRIKELLIRGTKGTARVSRELEIRKLFGGLKSSMFIVRPVWNVLCENEEGMLNGPGLSEGMRDGILMYGNERPCSFTFIGGGWGHGVGLCQTGAWGMALKEKKYTEILMHYFSESSIVKIY